jgi:hypothetical protein
LSAANLRRGLTKEFDSPETIIGIWIGHGMALDVGQKPCATEELLKKVASHTETP